MKLLILYCAFAYGAQFSKLIDILSDNETFEMFDNYAKYPFIFIPYIIAFILFILSPITFILEIIYNIYEVIIKNQL